MTQRLHNKKTKQQRQEQEEELRFPLLTNTNHQTTIMASSYEWPLTEEIEKSIELFVPKEWSGSITSSTKCFLRYQKEDHLFHVLSTDNESNLLDVIDPSDVLGVDIEIKPQQPQAQSQPQTEEEEGDSRPTSNEPDPSEECSDDRNGFHATLTIYAYPKSDPSKQSWLNWCNLTTYVPQPDPTNSGRRGSGSDDNDTLGNRIPFHRTFSVVPCEDLQSLSVLGKAIQTVAQQSIPNNNNNTATSEQPTYLVVINPFSGPKKNGKEVYETVLKPMLQQAKIKHDVFVTEYAHHAEHRMRKQGPQPPRSEADITTATSGEEEEADATTATSTTPNEGDNTTDIIATNDTTTNNNEKDISEYDAIVTMGGDGTLYEVLQGLFKRDDTNELLERLRFGIIGCGSANGYAKSIAHASGEKCSPMDSAFLVCKQHARRVDTSYYTTATQRYFSFLTFSWGLVADVDIESEVLRWLGSLRFEVWTVWRILSLRKYRARFSYKPAVAATAAATSNSTTTTTRRTLPSSGSSSGTNNEKSEFLSLDDPIPDDWVTLEDEFVFFWTSQVTHAAETMFSSPTTTFEDGVFQILVVRSSISRYDLIKILLGIDSGKHIDLFVPVSSRDDAAAAQDAPAQLVACTDYRIEPENENDTYNDLDGEVIASGPIQGHVLPGNLNLFCF